MSSSSSCAKPEFENGQIVSGFEVVRKLGSGGFGAVYLVQRDGVEWAMKTEFGDEDETLRNEVHTLRMMQWSPAFCRLHTAKRLKWKDMTINMMVMSLCIRPLSRLRHMMPRNRFSKSTAARLSLQLLKAIHDLHSSGLLHRDVKLSNCGWHEPTRRILLFDLGFCRKFLEIDPETQKMRHRIARKKAGFMGTSKYCSLFVHEELEQGRRDDLWAWLYSVSEMFLGSLPWSGEDNSIVVNNMKRKTNRGLFYKCPREVVPMYEHISQLKYDSRPDYDLLLNLFNQMYVRLDIDESDPLDFEPGSVYFEKHYLDKKTDSEIELERGTMTGTSVDTVDRSAVGSMPELVSSTSASTASSPNPMESFAESPLDSTAQSTI